MVKLKGPLLSTEARGSLGPRLTYSKKKSGQQTRYQRKQIYSNSIAQAPQNNYFDLARAAWQTLSDADKLEWHNFNKS